jgi:hypothetical protein
MSNSGDKIIRMEKDDRSMWENMFNVMEDD